MIIDVLASDCSHSDLFECYGRLDCGLYWRSQDCLATQDTPCSPFRTRTRTLLYFFFLFPFHVYFSVSSIMKTTITAIPFWESYYFQILAFLSISLYSRNVTERFISVGKTKKNKLHVLSPRANYTDRATAASRRSGCQLMRIRGATWSAWRNPTAVFSIF
jgi:membrane protein implicated in regulation of membrane protease activity